MTAQGVASWTEIADGTLCGRDPDEIGVPARWALDGTEDERQGFSQSREKGGEGVRVSATSLQLIVALPRPSKPTPLMVRLTSSRMSIHILYKYDWAKVTASTRAKP